MQRSGILAVLALLAASRPAAAQRLTPDVPAKSAAIVVTGKIAGKNFQGSGEGSCRHAEDASIHDVSAALWLVNHFVSNKGVVFTIYEPAGEVPTGSFVTKEPSEAELERRKKWAKEDA